MKPFLILQLRSLDGAADSEFAAFLKYGNLKSSEVRRVRMEQESFARINLDDYSGVIVGGGPSNVSDEEEEKPDFQRRFESELDLLYEQIFARDLPYLGSCYGLGSVVRYAGGLVSKENYSEAVGTTEVQLTALGRSDPMLSGLPEIFTAFVGHKEAAQSVPPGGSLLGSSTSCLVQIIRFRQNIYATQFHCELDASGIADRIHYYRNHGYFDPESADRLINDTRNLVAEVPQLILRRFTDRYRASG